MSNETDAAPHIESKYVMQYKTADNANWRSIVDDFGVEKEEEFLNVERAFLMDARKNRIGVRLCQYLPDGHHFYVVPTEFQLIEKRKLITYHAVPEIQ